jgi:hypothetical protein
MNEWWRRSNWADGRYPMRLERNEEADLVEASWQNAYSNAGKRQREELHAPRTT